MFTNIDGVVPDEGMSSDGDFRVNHTNNNNDNGDTWTAVWLANLAVGSNVTLGDVMEDENLAIKAKDGHGAGDGYRDKDDAKASRKKFWCAMRCTKCHNLRHVRGKHLPNINTAYKSRSFCSGWHHMRHRYRLETYLEKEKKPVAIVRPFSLVIE